MKTHNRKQNPHGSSVVMNLLVKGIFNYLRHELIEYLARLIEYLFQ